MTAEASVRPAPTSGKQGRDRTPERYAALETLWRESALPSVCKCARVPLSGGNVAVKASGLAGLGRTAGFAGLFRCGSTWACPECSAKIAATRKAELSEAIAAARARGWVVSHLVLTMRHHKGQSLTDLWGAVSYAWGAATSGRAWVADQAHYSLEGWCRLVEVTVGQNGWHVHVHALLFTSGQGMGRNPADLGPVMFQRWAAACRRKTMRAPSAKSGGLSIRVLGGAEDLAGYFTKNVYEANTEAADVDGLALEVARGDLKAGRHGNRSPFEVLADVVQLGLVDDLETWHEWEQGSKGRKQMTWSKGLRALLVSSPELSDEEIAEQDEGGAVLLELERDVWDAICRERGTRATVRGLAMMDNDGTALRAYLRARGWGWLEPHVAGPIDVGALAFRRGKL